MAADRCAPATHSRHRQLRAWAGRIPQVLTVDTFGQPPQLETEVVVRGDRLPPNLVTAIGRAGLGVVSVDRQGTAVVATVR